jgi:hypothetical protein
MGSLALRRSTQRCFSHPRRKGVAERNETLTTDILTARIADGLAVCVPPPEWRLCRTAIGARLVVRLGDHGVLSLGRTWACSSWAACCATCTGIEGVCLEHGGRGRAHGWGGIVQLVLQGYRRQLRCSARWEVGLDWRHAVVAVSSHRWFKDD